MADPTSDSNPSLRLGLVRFIHGIINNLSRAFLVVMVLSISYTVFGRFVLNNTPAWGEPVGLFCMVWFSLLSMSIAFIDKSHLRMSVLEMIFKEKKLRGIDLVIYLVLVGFSVFMIIYGAQVTKLTWPTVMPGLQISRGLLYLSLPVSGVFNLMILLLMRKEYLW